jgi:hypothetical protein
MSAGAEEKTLAEARALRTEAWALVKADMERLRDGLAEKPIGQRIKDKAVDEAMDVVDGAVAVANDNKAVIGATLAALAGWAFRGPLWKIVQQWLPDDRPDWLHFKGD